MLPAKGPESIVAEIDDAWAQAVKQAGWAIDTQIHAVGDGAEWIYQQYKQMFGSSPGRYLLDFYHVSEYLHAAGNETAALGQDWVKEQERRLLEGDSEGVLKSLKRNIWKRRAWRIPRPR